VEFLEEKVPCFELVYSRVNSLSIGTGSGSRHAKELPLLLAHEKTFDGPQIRVGAICLVSLIRTWESRQLQTLFCRLNK